MIEFSHVNKTYNQQQAVSDLNLHLGEGSFSVLMGQVANQTPAEMRGSASGIINAGSSFG